MEPFVHRAQLHQRKLNSMGVDGASTAFVLADHHASSEIIFGNLKSRILYCADFYIPQNNLKLCDSSNRYLTITLNSLGYEIEGRVGYSDCFCPTVCCPCAVTQLLNEVASRGPKIISATSGPWLAEKKDYSALGDPCDFFCTFLTCKCEMANVFSQLAGVPFWFALCSNFCQVLFNL